MARGLVVPIFLALVLAMMFMVGTNVITPLGNDLEERTGGELGDADNGGLNVTSWQDRMQELFYVKAPLMLIFGFGVGWPVMWFYRRTQNRGRR